MRSTLEDIIHFPGERWVDFIHDSDYKISDHGRIFSYKSKFISNAHNQGLLKVAINNLGYCKQCLARKVWSIHRLVALHFIPNPLNLPEVHHKDHNKTNNHYTNLEWVTHEQNIKYARLEGRWPLCRTSQKPRKPVSKETKAKMSLAKKGTSHPKFKGFYEIEGMRFDSASACAKHYNTSTTQILRKVKKGIIKIVPG